MEGNSSKTGNSVRDQAASDDQTGTLNSFDTATDLGDEVDGNNINNQVNVLSGNLDSQTTTHEVSHALGVGHTDEEPTGQLLSKGGNASPNTKYIAESLQGVGIGGNTAARNGSNSNGDGTVISGSVAGLEKGKVVSNKKYTRIVNRINRKLEKTRDQ